MLNTHYGATYSYRRRYFRETLALPDSVRALEVLVDHFLPFTRERKAEIDHLRDRFVLLPHSLDLSLGSADGLREPHLRAVREVVHYMQAPLWSDHLAFTRVDGITIGHLAPLPFTDETLQYLTRNIRFAQDYLNLPMLVENISAQFRIGGPEFDEVAMLHAVCSKTDVRLLFDLANLQSGPDDPVHIINQIEPQYVALLHIAGGTTVEGIYVDAHDRPVSDQVWEYLDVACRRFAPLAVIVERDMHLPPFFELRAEIAHAAMILNEASACRS